jgi:Flp pilus assembly pilin Flp
MFTSFTRALSNLREHENGLTSVEYVVMAALALVGLCIAAYTTSRL